MKDYQGIRVLIVDDDLDLRSSLIDYFKSSGYDTTGAKNGLRAIDLIKKTHFDIVLLDLNMPVMNGMQTMREIQKISPSTFIFIITGEFDVEKYQYYRNGCVLFEKKPLDVIEIELKIRNIFKISKEKNPRLIPTDTFINLEINLIYEFILINIDNPSLNIDFISKSLAMSKSYIYKIFKTYLTIGCHETIKNIRLLKAYNTAKKGSVKSIKDLSISVGYLDSGYFSKVYKEAFNQNLSDIL
jgi:YesN/AraC family two-component response regulator